MSYMLSDKVDFKAGDRCVASIPILMPKEAVVMVLARMDENHFNIRLPYGTEVVTAWFNLRPLTASEALPFVEF